MSERNVTVSGGESWMTCACRDIRWPDGLAITETVERDGAFHRCTVSCIKDEAQLTLAPEHWDGVADAVSFWVTNFNFPRYGEAPTTPEWVTAFRQQYAKNVQGAL